VNSSSSSNKFNRQKLASANSSAADLWQQEQHRTAGQARQQWVRKQEPLRASNSNVLALNVIDLLYGMIRNTLQAHLLALQDAVCLDQLSKAGSAATHTKVEGLGSNIHHTMRWLQHLQRSSKSRSITELSSAHPACILAVATHLDLHVSAAAPSLSQAINQRCTQAGASTECLSTSTVST
jgi:hypothetical protein